MTSVIIGVSSVTQLDENLAALDNLEFDEDELAAIDASARRATSRWPPTFPSTDRRQHMD